MKRITRTLASAGLGLAIAAGSLATAAPAQAVGEGCYGFPSIPDAYVCVVQVTPANAVPDVNTGTTYVGTIPSFCYGAGCTGDTPVYVPIASVNPEDAPILVVFYKGQTYTIGTAGVGGGLPGTDALDPWVEYGLSWVDFALGLVTTIRDIVDQLDPQFDCSGLEETLGNALDRTVNIRQC